MKIGIRILIYIVFINILAFCSNDKLIIYRHDISENWKLISSKLIDETGDILSSLVYDDSLWFQTNIPSTVLNSIVTSSGYDSLYMGINIKNIGKEQFKSSWWYRKVFHLNKKETVYIIEFEGINYSANIWLNGKLVADTSKVINPFRQFKFNITELVKTGKNVLAIEVFPPEPGDFSVGFVDWNPSPPDQNMGVFRKVNILMNKGIGLSETYIQANPDTINYSKADIYIKTRATNYTYKNINATLVASIDNITVYKNISLDANESKIITITPDDDESLSFENPKLWWPHTYGEPNLYTANIQLTQNGSVLDKTETNFGIRHIESYFTDQGHRGFKINGQKILVRGGGWVDNLTLNNTYENIRSQLEYVKDMNLNTIRLEGFWGTDQSIYRLCDEMGILIMVGWSCHWEWEEYVAKACHDDYGGILTDDEIELMSAAWKDQIIWLRNHPSIFAWFAGSDKIPTPKLEENYFNILSEYDSTRVYLSSAAEWISLAGPSGMKMRGPYAYTPPVYWFEDSVHGGAFGFNSETGPGPQVPPLESIKKMIPEKNLWPINEVWDYHSGRNNFNKLDRYSFAIDKRYGKTNNVEEYAQKAQLMNYELMRAMFEAFTVRRYTSTGVIQWMLNSSWPEMYWQLYDYYLMPNGSYYGAKKAGTPIHALYDYSQDAVYMVNDQLKDRNELQLSVRIFNDKSELLYDKNLSVNCLANFSKKVLDLPKLERLSTTYFLHLEVKDKNNTQIDRNFYWLSTINDRLDYKNSLWYYTPSSHYADYTSLSNLKKVKIEYTLTERTDDTFQYFDISLSNPNKNIAFFINLGILDKETGLSILPVIWSDNYVSLLPGETSEYTAKIRKEYLFSKTPFLKVEGLNIIIKGTSNNYFASRFSEFFIDDENF